MYWHSKYLDVSCYLSDTLYTPRKRFGILTAFLLDRLPQLTDELIDLYIRLVGRWFNKADKRGVGA
jgi:hypothetical protein